MARIAVPNSYLFWSCGNDTSYMICVNATSYMMCVNATSYITFVGRKVDTSNDFVCHTSAAFEDKVVRIKYKMCNSSQLARYF